MRRAPRSTCEHEFSIASFSALPVCIHSIDKKLAGWPDGQCLISSLSCLISGSDRGLLSVQPYCRCLSQTHAEGALLSLLVGLFFFRFFHRVLVGCFVVLFFGCAKPKPQSLEVFLHGTTLESHGGSQSHAVGWRRRREDAVAIAKYKPQTSAGWRLCGATDHLRCN